MDCVFKTCVAALALIAAAPAAAALTPALDKDGKPVACSASQPDPDAVKCGGYYDGNLNNDSRVDDLNAAIDLLVGPTEDIPWSEFESTKIESTDPESDSGVLTFEEMLFGYQILSIHFGGSGVTANDATALFLFNFGTEGALSVQLNREGWSNVVTTPGGGVPEPGTWGMMLMGFGAAGYAMRRRRNIGAIAQVA